MSVLVLVFIIAGLTSNLEGGVRGNRQEKEAFDQKQEEVQTEQKNQGEETQVVSNPNIRVLLMTDGYKNTIHPSVTVSSTSGLSITYGDTKTGFVTLTGISRLRICTIAVSPIPSGTRASAML